jgi:MG2 domain-containing protein
MGAVQTPSPDYNSFQKERLGWLNYGTSPSITTVTAGGTYVINAYELGGSGPNALKILKSIDPTTGAKTWYYIEARQSLGFDAFLTDGTCAPCYTQNETDGVLLHIGTDGDGNSGDLLDLTPATPAYYFWFDPSLATGQTFQDPSAGLTITTDWVTSTQAEVNVQFSGGVTVATNQPSYSPGQTVSATATATYAGSPVANVSVNFTITKPNGAVVAGSATTKTNGAAVYSMRLRNSDPVGTYNVAVATTLAGMPAAAATTFTVQ